MTAVVAFTAEPAIAKRKTKRAKSSRAAPRRKPEPPSLDELIRKADRLLAQTREAIERSEALRQEIRIARLYYEDRRGG